MGAGYCVLLFVLGSLRPLWLDEVIQLYFSHQPVNHGFFEGVRTNAGATPLGYIIGAASERTFGVTWLGSRLPSLLAGVAAVAALYLFAVELGIDVPILAAALLAICPLQLRYATEGRPYELALVFSILSSLWAIRLNRNPSLQNTALYSAILTIGIYFQPFVVFVAIGNALWAGYEGVKIRRLKPLGCFLLASAIAAAALALWLRFASPAWHYERAGALPRLLLNLIREIAGDGYVCSIPLIAAAIAGFRKAHPLVAITTFAALLGPLAADAELGYFFAIRQFVFALPGLAVAASIGFVAIRKRSRAAGAALLLTFLAGTVFKTASYFAERREDWNAAATYLNSRTADGDCVSFLAPDSVVLYALFAPALQSHVCSASKNSAHRITALTPEMPDRFRQEFQRETSGLPIVSVGGTLIATR